MPDSASALPDLPAGVRQDLDSFDPRLRREALAKAVALVRGLPPPRDREPVNNHIHTFYSYCSMNLSPYSLIWEAARRGLAVAGSTDFDVLDAMNEVYEAGDALSVRATVSLETRAFAGDFADREINSPGEPGIVYVMGAGFVRKPEGDLFPSLADRSRRRNEEMVARINPALAPAGIDYAADILPLTPSGNATERHICEAYDRKARRLFPAPAALAAFWADKLGGTSDAAAALLEDAGALRNAIRARFMKQGGVGYAKPDRDAFPPVEDFFRMVDAAGAIPCLAWLDGLSPGEADPAFLLDRALSWGAGAVNVIPERNWNIADPSLKKRKLAALDAFARAARERCLPILAGTELNSPGQKFVDSFEAPELAPYVDDFRDAAYWLYGHTVLERAAGMGARSAWAGRSFAGDRARAAAFYREMGKAFPPGRLPDGLDEGMDPETVRRYAEAQA